MQKAKKKRGIVFLAWGKKYIELMKINIHKGQLPNYPIFLITDENTQVDQFDARLTIIRTKFKLIGRKGHARKSELWENLPEGFDSMLFLDVDTRVLGDISLGFDKAEKFGIAMAQAAHYSLDYFNNYSRIMAEEGIKPQGQLLYNSGVIFFSITPSVEEVFKLYRNLCEKYSEKSNSLFGDQVHLTLAMEKLNFNPYTLSTSYNHRAFGELISGKIYIWHSRKSVPANVNDLTSVFPIRYSRLHNAIVNATPYTYRIMDRIRHFLKRS